MSIWEKIFGSDSSAASPTSKIRNLVEALQINPNLDTLLGQHTSGDSGFTYTISARECTPLTSETLVGLLSQIIESSRSVVGGSYEQIIWDIGFGKDFGGGPSVADERRIGRFGFWFREPGGDQSLFRASARFHYRSGPMGGLSVSAIRCSTEDYRAAVSHYSQMKDLNDKPWTKKDFW